MFRLVLLSFMTMVIASVLAHDVDLAENERMSKKLEPLATTIKPYLSIFSSLLESVCDSYQNNCIFNIFGIFLGFLTIINTSALCTIVITRSHTMKNNQTTSTSGEKTEKKSNFNGLVLLILACCFIENFIIYSEVYYFGSRIFPLSTITNKCEFVTNESDKLVFMFCQLGSSFFVVFPISLLGAFVWFRGIYHQFLFLFYVVICHMLSNLTAVFLISSPFNNSCNLSMQRVMITFVMYSCILLGVLVVQFYRKSNMQNDEKISSNNLAQGSTETVESVEEEKVKPMKSEIRTYEEEKEIDNLYDKVGLFHSRGSRVSLSKKKPLSMRFGTDEFLPCIVLTRKNARTTMSPILTNISNIGLSSKTQSRPVHRRASLGVIKERINHGGDDSSSWGRISQRRRTSLPTAFHSTRKQAVMSSVLVETSVISELNSALNDLEFFAKTQPDVEHIVMKLKRLLKPYNNENLRPSQVVWLHDSLSSTSDGSDDEDIVRGSRMSFNKRLISRRADWTNSEGSVWTTTTSATGLPSQDPGPIKSKRIPKLQKTPNATPHDSRCNSPICGKEMNLTRRRTIHVTGSLHSPARSQTFFPKQETTKNGESGECKKTFPSSDYESCDNIHTDSSETEVRLNVQSHSPLSRSPARDLMQNSTLRQSNVENPHYDAEQMSKIRLCITEPTIDEDSQEEDEDRVADSDSILSNHSGNSSDEVERLNEETTHSENEEINVTKDIFEGIEYEAEILDQVNNWNFPIFELADNTHCVLSQMSYKLFDDTGLFESFRIPRKSFVNYMRALENGYRNNPYHNRIHAADVLHGCWFMTTQEIPGFKVSPPLFSSDSSDSDSGTSHTQLNTAGHGSLAQAIPALELMALYLAASMHDYDHPGRTNAFLVETKHPLAILYNDRSVLENHHASASWELLYSRKDGAYDFLVNLDLAEWKRLRFLIIEAILATDLKKHFELMGRFSSKLSKRPEVAPSSSESADPVRHEGFLKWTADEDRLLVCQMIIKLADIGGPTKTRDIHVTWTKAICQEFFMQGDEERSLNSTVSPFMNRDEPQVAQLQRTFIKNLIEPLVVKMHKAGILAGYATQMQEKLMADDTQDPVDEEITTSRTQSLIREQLADNLRYWHSISQKEMEGNKEMELVFQCAHNVTLEQQKTPQPIFSSVTKLSLNNRMIEKNADKETENKLHGANRSDVPLTTKIPGFTRNMLPRSKPSESNNPTVCNSNKSKLPRISHK